LEESFDYGNLNKGNIRGAQLKRSEEAVKKVAFLLANDFEDSEMQKP
jgi:hypothetical protein